MKPNGITKGESQSCPICGVKQQPNSRYPHHLCRKCAALATDKSGRPLEFYNVGISGGFEARYVDSGKTRKSHVCYVNGVKCWADEARFGGIVIQTLH